ncbi:GNAT family N-acetyltransferase [Streptomyces sp. NBC_01618]|uniref:GNAT family N-acetyltransferase n=1 Tax=Streptomyces sp. NBC_01618 TaxID=2975900 RepID=UPI003870C230|nr:GNAT family N-acetyltransferase [Streptomyces sp. NBC_01618]
MTTTLRPTGPIQQGADGAKSRSYDVCDNGRPVGAVEIGTDPRFGASVGVLRSLSVDESRRRRGRGTIAVLAAEEVLRGWGCTQVRLAAPEGNEGAQGLAAALGYTERGRNMLKELDRTAPALLDGVVARQMSAEEFARWQSTSVDTYTQSWIDQGVPAEQAIQKSRNDYARNLPDGMETAGMHFHVLVHEGVVVGHLWVSVREESPGEKAGYVFDVEVGEEYRGRGYGRALMWQAEHITLDAGAHRLGLHVFAGNTPAQRLYESLGYRTTQYNLAKTF